jgi:hypothetical protein
VKGIGKAAWTPLGGQGLDCCWLVPWDAGSMMDGCSFRYDEPVMAALFTVQVGVGWATRLVDVTRFLPQPKLRLELRADGRGRWWRDGEEAPELEGCIDVDLGCTPATNTLPIRRLGLAVGQEAEIVAAWVRFPELEVRSLPERYRRLAPDRYEYASTTFRAELDVDEHGLVIDYAGAWVRDRADPGPGQSVGDLRWAGRTTRGRRRTGATARGRP